MSPLPHEAANAALTWAPFDQGGDLLASERTALARHVDGCEGCQADEAGLARFLGAWERVVSEDRAGTGAAGAPDVGLVWERVQGELAAKELGKQLGRDPGRNPGKDPGRGPGKNPGKNPGRDPGRNPGRNPGKGARAEEPSLDGGAGSQAGAGLEVRRLGSERSPSTCSFCHGYLAQRGRVLCRSCGAPHHLGCFRAHGRCSTLGCEQTRFARPQPEVEPARPLRPAEWRLSLVIRALAAAASLLICVSAGALAWERAARAIEDDQTQRALSVLDVGLSSVSAGYANVRASLGDPSAGEVVDPEAQERDAKIAEARNLVLRRTLLELTRRTEVVAAALALQRRDGRSVLLEARVGQGAPAGLSYSAQRSLHEVGLPGGGVARADVGRLGDFRGRLTASAVLRVRAPLREADQVLDEGEVELWVCLDRGLVVLAKERTFHLVAFLTLVACCLVLGVFSWWCVRQRARVRRAAER